MNFYGTKLATCSSDRALRIFDVSLGQQKLVTTLVGLVGVVFRLVGLVGVVFRLVGLVGVVS